MITQTYYKVFKVFRKSQRRVILRRNLSEAEARILVNSYPESNRSMVCYTRQANYSNAKKQ